MHLSVDRIPLNEARLRLQHGLAEPVVVAGAYEEYEAWCDEFIAATSDELVQVQFSGVEEEAMTVWDFVNGPALDSTHQEPAFVFEEGLLDPSSYCAKEATRVRESVADDEDWFSCFFPEELRPTDCVVMAGEGATSTLHRDPFEWLGTSLCMEGSKLWRFVRSDRLTGYRRLQSQAFGLSAGWQIDDQSLFSTRHASVPSAREFSEMNEERLDRLLEISLDERALAPSVDAPFLAAVQDAGDLVLIPKDWTHQTYALEPSISVASQRCGNNDAESVFRHILHNTNRIKDGEHLLKEIAEMTGTSNRNGVFFTSRRERSEAAEEE